MTKKLNSFAASLASTSTVPRLLFERNQLEPEISRKLVTGFSRDRYIAPMLSNAARSPPLASRSWSYSCCRSARSRRLTEGPPRFCSAPAWLPRWLVNLWRQEPWSETLRRQHHLRDVFAVLNGPRRLGRRKRPSDPPHRTPRDRTRRSSN
jgi:hypothetical protein